MEKTASESRPAYEDKRSQSTADISSASGGSRIWQQRRGV